MKFTAKSNFLRTYETTLTELAQSPNSPELQHRAVLALARAGSLDFAWAEYRRYGLDEIDDLQDTKLLEDILGLGARLLKDLYLSNRGKLASDYAKQSAIAYQKAYAKTGGYYSGINAATMDFIAGSHSSEINQKVDIILQALPVSQDIDSESLYFIEATRAEAFLLKGEIFKARRCLQTAIKHDPQNYAAHSTTLKQLKMILAKQAIEADWLANFEPPKPTHYSGHLFKTEDGNQMGSLAKAEQETLKIRISDSIQKHDIGFGYGALAAGSDIVIAEILLEEGCDLHVLLPVPKDIFLEHSVRAFGQDWEARFHSCWERASSCEIVTQNSNWPENCIDLFANKIAMGKAVHHAAQLSVEAQQLLVWDQKIGQTGTARNAEVWHQTKRSQIIVDYPGRRNKLDDDVVNSDYQLCVALCVDGGVESMTHQNLTDAIDSALNIQIKNGHESRIGLDVDMTAHSDVVYDRAKELAHHTVPGGILVSEAVACLLSLNHQGEFETDYMGRIGDNHDGIRAFSFKRKT